MKRAIKQLLLLIMAKLPQNKNKGYFLIELMVSISILTIGFLGFLTLVSRSISTNRIISDYLTANYLAAEGIELIKNTIDTNYLRNDPWNQGLASDGDYEMAYDDNIPINITGSPVKFLDYKNGFYNYDISGSQSPFKRTIAISNISASQIKVKSRVYWISRGGGTMDIYLEDYFFNWKE